MEKKRDLLADQLKGYACLLVVFGHVIMGIRKAEIIIPQIMLWLEMFIWTFHVPLFIFLSGYVFRITGGWQAKGLRKNFVIHKSLNLGIPYFMFSTIYIIINSSVAGVNNSINITDILYLWKTAIAQYWFLHALLILFIIWTILPSGDTKANRNITVICLLVYWSAPLFNVKFGSFSAAMGMILPFGLGTCIAELKISKWSARRKMVVIAFQLILITIFIKCGITGKRFIDEVEIILGIVGSISLISLLNKNVWFAKVLGWLNRYSFPIYLLHTIFTAAVRIVLIKLGVDNYLVHVMVGLIVGLFVPFICAKIANHVTVIDFFFYPSKNLKKLNLHRIG